MPFKPPPHLSPSSIGTYKQCPLKFKYSKIDLMQEDPTEATLMGNFVHEVLETLYALEPEKRTQQEAKTIASSLWSESWMDRVTPWVKGEEKLRMFRWKSWWCIENLWKIENPEKTQPAGIEHELNGQIGGVTIKGFIDRYSWEGLGYVISDYKTGKTPKAAWVQDKFFQLVVYSHLLQSTGVGHVQSVELLYLKDGVSFKQEVTEKMLSEVEEQVVSVKQQIDFSCENEDFKPNKSILCDWCSFRKVCPAWRS